MVLANTAVPREYGAFRDAVLRGEIPVNREISMQMNRIDNDIDNPNFYYDDEATAKMICTVSSGITVRTSLQRILQSTLQQQDKSKR